MAVSSEIKLVSAAAGLYGSFLYWGYLQEKITGADYVSPVDASVTGRWHFSFVLNGETREAEGGEADQHAHRTPESLVWTTQAPPSAASLGRRGRPARESPPPSLLAAALAFEFTIFELWERCGTHSDPHNTEHVSFVHSLKNIPSCFSEGQTMVVSLPDVHRGR